MSANSNDMDNEANRLFLVWKKIVENRPLKINHKINPEEAYDPRDAFFSVLKGDRPLASIEGGLTLVEKKALSKLVDSKTLGLLEYDSPCPSIDIKHMDVYRIGYEDEARMLMNITITNNLRALKEEALGGSKTSQKIMSYDRILNTCEAYGKLYRYTDESIKRFKSKIVQLKKDALSVSMKKDTFFSVTTTTNLSGSSMQNNINDKNNFTQ